MIKKILTAVAFASVLASGAQAQNNTGFEAGNTTGWTTKPGITLSAVTEFKPTFEITDPVTGDVTTCNQCYTVTPAAGQYFGSLTPYDVGGPNSPFDVSFDGSVTTTANNLGWGAATTSAETVFMRMITLDYGYTGDLAQYNDKVTVTFTGGAGGSFVIDGKDMTSVDSQWQAFAVPLGTTGLKFSVTDAYGGGIANTPVGVLFDFTPSAVPEPESVAMMLAGLAVLGAKGRRRAKANKAAAA